MRSRYNFTFDEITNTYVFITKNGILYRIAFVIDETFSTISGEKIKNVYQIVVEKATDEIEPYDLSVSRTVENIIELFFQRVENALIFVCSDDKDKALKRFKTFDRSASESQRIYTSFIFHEKNPNFSKLISIYYKIEEVLNEDK